MCGVTVRQVAGHGLYPALKETFNLTIGHTSTSDSPIGKTCHRPSGRTLSFARKESPLRQPRQPAVLKHPEADLAVAGLTYFHLDRPESDRVGLSEVVGEMLCVVGPLEAIEVFAVGEAKGLVLTAGVQDLELKRPFLRNRLSSLERLSGRPRLLILRSLGAVFSDPAVLYLPIVTDVEKWIRPYIAGRGN